MTSSDGMDTPQVAKLLRFYRRLHLNRLRDSGNKRHAFGSRFSKRIDRCNYKYIPISAEIAKEARANRVILLKELRKRPLHERQRTLKRVRFDSNSNAMSKARLSSEVIAAESAKNRIAGTKARLDLELRVVETSNDRVARAKIRLDARIKALAHVGYLLDLESEPLA
eukprot:CAMPEP_0196581752 /NCGR_PEP_ID=MMETSP1081-20130531/35361_1 /TAXON_ID=36882 /ORGANISM="Pyramimonas amylifera, Strain CCMP720" /LENGTH=167 /DNA_ID=CAMNT_0041902093 /DNA_START=280 /DNA_END=783 /DNA_ORIENTATION=+